MILYLGNMLSRHGKSPALMELIVPRLSKHINIKAYSDQKSQVGRLVQMMMAVVRYRSQCSLVMIDTFSTTAFWYCYILSMMCRLFNIPYLPVLHGGLFETRLKQTPRLSRQVFNHAAANISPSLFLKQIFEQNQYTVINIPNFISLEDYPFGNRTLFKPRLLWVRAFHEIYNPYMAIQAIKLLADQFPEASLTMVGSDKDGSMERSKQMARELGVEDRINFTGYLSKEEWIGLSAEHDFFINTSTADNMPVSVMEGMSLGLVVISTNVGGIPFLLRDRVDAYLVDSNDSKSMADRIKEVILQPQVGRQLTEAARHKSETFSWPIIQAQWLLTINQFKKKR